MEEDIKILEEIIEYCKEHLPPYYKDRDLQAIENLIKGYKKLEAKTKRYEKYLENKDKKFEEALEYEYQERETDYIPKSKIKKKLERLKKNEDCRYCNNACSKYARCMMLKELMEDK